MAHIKRQPQKQKRQFTPLVPLHEQKIAGKPSVIFVRIETYYPERENCSKWLNNLLNWFVYPEYLIVNETEKQVRQAILDALPITLLRKNEEALEAGEEKALEKALEKEKRLIFEKALKNTVPNIHENLYYMQRLNTGVILIITPAIVLDSRLVDSEAISMLGYGTLAQNIRENKENFI